ncbi:MAG: hypothetical protein DRG69_09765, partial [Deltaproteobacteria bacterium]
MLRLHNRLDPVGVEPQRGHRGPISLHPGRPGGQLPELGGPDHPERGTVFTEQELQDSLQVLHTGPAQEGYPQWASAKDRCAVREFQRECFPPHQLQALHQVPGAGIGQQNRETPLSLQGCERCGQVPVREARCIELPLPRPELHGVRVGEMDAREIEDGPQALTGHLGHLLRSGPLGKIAPPPGLEGENVFSVREAKLPPDQQFDFTLGLLEEGFQGIERNREHPLSQVHLHPGERELSH